MAYVVSFLDGFAANLSAGEILDTVVSRAVEGGKWEVLSDGEIDLAGKPGRDLLFKMKATGVPSARGSYRAYVVDQRVYQLIVVASEPDWNPKVARAFLNSFKIVPDVRIKPPTSPGPAQRLGRSAPSGSEPLPDGLAAIPPRDQFGFFGQPHLDLAPHGGKLVGIRVGYIDAFGGQMIGCVRPVYQVGEDQVEGAKIGRDVPLTDAAIAPPGYFVGAIDFRQGLMLNGFQLVYFKDAGDHLDEGDSRKSDWLGDQKGGSPGTVTSSGFVIAGLQVRAGNEVNAIGLIIRKWESKDRPKPIPTDGAARQRSEIELRKPFEAGAD